jgi:cephalosporin-C deacetylase
MQPLAHPYPFDPSYGYTLPRLLQIPPPPAPADFAAFWQRRYRQALTLDPQPRLGPVNLSHPRLEVFDLEFLSTDGFRIGGWLVRPRDGVSRRAFIMGHGYGGIQAPDFDLPFLDAVYVFPCFRGLSRSRRAPISEDPNWHVLHDIDQRHRYILGGCVADLWLAVSALLRLHPTLSGHLGYLGISFGGGIGALAMPWDQRIGRVHLFVPSFGHHPLRLTLPTTGSGEALRRYQRAHGNVMETLQYYDAASAAAYMTRPVLVAAALFDPVVAPPGQFAIYNALVGDKRLFLLDAGHFPYPRQAEQQARLKAAIRELFEPL